MKRVFVIIISIILALGNKGIAQIIPFEMPPDGKAELLLGDIKLKAPTAMAFDSKNRPYLLNNRNTDEFGQLRTVRNGEWVSISLLDKLKHIKPPTERDMHGNGELVIDDDDAIYATLGRSNTLVYSPDGGKTFKAYPCQGSLELRVGHNRLILPPAICVTKNMHYVDRPGERSKEMAWWAKRGQLSVLLPEKSKNGLVLGEAVVISENCLAAGSGGHSGGTSFAVTIEGKTHIVYAETPSDPRKGGNLIYIATVDRKTRAVIAKEFLVVALPEKTDVHTRPTITHDSEGYLHVLSGSHGQPFFYLRSLKPNDISSGWTKPIQLTGRQCYASIVCDEDNQLHSVFREWIPHATLGYSTAAPPDYNWIKPKTIVQGANPKGTYEYGIFYQRLFIDRNSNLYLSFTFWEQKSRQNGNYPEALIISRNGGESWQLAGSETLIKNINQKQAWSVNEHSVVPQK